MPSELCEYEGQHHYTAAHMAGLELYPDVKCGLAHTQSLRLHFNPYLPPRMQRTQIVRQIAERHAAAHGGSAADVAGQLDGLLLPA